MTGRRAKKHKAKPARKPAAPSAEELLAKAADFNANTAIALLTGMLQEELDQLRTQKLTGTERGTRQNRCFGMIGKLRELTGQDLSEKELVNHPRLRAVGEALAKALEPWPEAMVAAAKALEQMGAGT